MPQGEQPTSRTAIPAPLISTNGIGSIPHKQTLWRTEPGIAPAKSRPRCSSSICKACCSSYLTRLRGVVGSTSDSTETSYCQESGTRSRRTFLRTLMSVLEDFQVADTHRMILASATTTIARPEAAIGIESKPRATPTSN